MAGYLAIVLCDTTFLMYSTLDITDYSNYGQNTAHSVCYHNSIAQLWLLTKFPTSTIMKIINRNRMINSIGAHQ